MGGTTNHESADLGASGNKGDLGGEPCFQTKRGKIMHSKYADRFSSDLAQARADLLNEYFNCQKEMSSGEYRKVVGSGLEEGDRSIMYHFDQMTLFKLASCKKQIDQIDRALGMIKSGNYGSCSCCHNEIGAARLRSVPFTVYCRDCQERLDGRAKERASKVAC